jgi:iron complex transport system substrate-binding protein
VGEGAPSQKTCRPPRNSNPSRKEDSLLRRSLTLAAVVAAALALVASASPSRHASPPTRIVSLSPTITEDLYAVGAGKQVVAVDEDSDYPKAAPRTKLSGLNINVESLASYNPDLVIVSYGGGAVAQMRKLGMKVLLAPAVDDVAQAYQQIREIGAVTGHAAQAARVVRGMERKLTRLIRSVPKTHRHLRVYHELDPTYYSATSATFIGRIYKLFGFRNIADAADTTHSGYPQLSAEYILTSNPQLVVLADSVCCSQNAKTVAARPGWSQLDAVEHHRVIAVDDSVASRWGPRLVDFAAAIAGAARRG